MAGALHGRRRLAWGWCKTSLVWRRALASLRLGGAGGGLACTRKEATAAAKVSTGRMLYSFVKRLFFARAGINASGNLHFPIYSLRQQGDANRSICSRGETGRRVRLRSAWGDPWRFESSREHDQILRSTIISLQRTRD